MADMGMDNVLASLALAITAMVAACGGGQGQGNGTDTTTDAASTSGVSTETGGATSTSGSTGATTDLPEPDGECRLFGQDCTDPGLKCMLWSLEADRIPDETRCCDIVANPKQVDETCEIFDYDGSCLDDCDRGAICILETDTLGGFCHQFCSPTDETTCDANETCKPFFEMLDAVPEVPICMDKCDPLTQDCLRPGWSCLPDFPTTAGQSGFICTPPPPINPAGFGDTCALANDCEVGLTCVPRERFSVCDFLFCCTSYCDLAAGNDPCPGLDPAMECVDWMAPDPRWQDVGVCAIPS